MHFKTLKEKSEYFRGLTDYRITPNSYVIAMLDGHCFSQLVKKHYNLPYDKNFMYYMDETAKYLLQNIQGAKLAYVQSDEISILITDFDTPETDSCFGFRLCKMQSLFASMAAGKFNQLVAIDLLKKNDGKFDDIPFGDISDVVSDMKPAAFDCKVWTVPSYNEAYGWFLYRQHDCTRNSKQQAAQTYLSHKSLLRLSADEQIEKLKNEKGIDWNDYTNGEKYGRIIYKVETHLSTEDVDGTIIHYTRNIWTAIGSEPFDNEDNIIRTLIPQR